jgi:hypothetical protein
MTHVSPSIGPLPPWAVTAEKVDAVVERLVAANDPNLLVIEPELSSRYNETVRLQKALRGILMSVDLVVTSQARYNERCRIPGTVEFTAHRHGRVLHDSL